MRFSVAALALGVVVMLVAAPAEAVTIHVPGDYATVCEATAVAQFGDTVLVGPGMYEYRDTDCVPVPDGVVLTSEYGPEESSLYAWTWGTGRGLIRFAPDAGTSTELSGFTILCADWEGWAETAAVYCHGGSPTVRNNVIRPAPGFPDALANAPGIYCMSSRATITNNTLVISPHHEQLFAFSCGILATGSWAEPLISHNIIVSADFGVHCALGASPIIDCNDYWDVEEVYTSGCTPGVGDFIEDPLFCDAQAGDFTLHCNSPAVHGYGCGLVGALPVGCGPTATAPRTWGLVKSLFDLPGE